jgi:hypothetical protein
MPRLAGGGRGGGRPRWSAGAGSGKAGARRRGPPALHPFRGQREARTRARGCGRKSRPSAVPPRIRPRRHDRSAGPGCGRFTRRSCPAGEPGGTSRRGRGPGGSACGPGAPQTGGRWRRAPRAAKRRDPAPPSSATVRRAGPTAAGSVGARRGRGDAGAPLRNVGAARSEPLAWAPASCGGRRRSRSGAVRGSAWDGPRTRGTSRRAAGLDRTGSCRLRVTGEPPHTGRMAWRPIRRPRPRRPRTAPGPSGPPQPAACAWTPRAARCGGPRAPGGRGSHRRSSGRRSCRATARRAPGSR